MLFDSPVFFAFLLIVVPLYWLLTWRAQNVFLLDGHHLNPAGAARYTALLRSELARALEQMQGRASSQALTATPAAVVSARGTANR
jgi:hypothetical protein